MAKWSFNKADMSLVCGSKSLILTALHCVDHHPFIHSIPTETQYSACNQFCFFTLSFFKGSGGFCGGGGGGVGCFL